MLVPKTKVNDAVCVMVWKELRLGMIEDSETQTEVVVSMTTVEDDVVGKDWGELRSGIKGEEWDQDVDWSDPGVVEIEKADEEDVLELWSNVVDVIIEAEFLEAVIELLCQSVVIVVHGANEVSIDRVEIRVQIESQLVTWVVFAGGRHDSASTFKLPSSCIFTGGSGQSGIPC